MGIRDLQAEALSLSQRDRARLAQSLLLSLDEATDDEVEKAWLSEVRRRCRAYKKGKTKTYPAEEVFRSARAKIR
jgi:putative addiction module component (TIGR02574 family)